jgi:phage terminase large subunit GpA-like protein
MQPLSWAGITWDSSNHRTAHYVCEHCNGKIYDRHKALMLPQGEWRADFPERENGEVYGYHLSSLYAPAGWRDASWPSLVREFLEAQGDPKLLKTFVNTRLGETWDDLGESDVDENELRARSETYAAPVPSAVAVLTAGVDVQGDRVEVEVVGWGVGEESWSIDYKVIPGDPTGTALWEDLEDYLLTSWHHETAGPVSIAAVAVDCGYETTHVQAFCHRNRRRRWYAVKGSSGPGKPMWPGRGKRGKKGRGEMFYSVGVDNAKGVQWRRLQRIDPGPGCLHFPSDRDLIWYQQLVAEAPRTTYHRGRARKEWVVRGSARSEALDCRVYAMCVLYSYLTTNRTLAKLHDALPVLTEAQAQRAMAAPAAPIVPPAQQSKPSVPQAGQRRSARRSGFTPRF